MNDNDEDLTPEEAAALRDLGRAGEAPAELEEAVLARMAQEGLLSGRRPARWRWFAAAAAGIALFALGLAVGSRRVAAGPPADSLKTQRYALFLYDAPGESLTDAQIAARVTEYRGWAQDLRRRGAEIGGEKLEDGSQVLGPPEASSSGWTLGGYFVVSADDDEAALALARACPHVRHGGRIEVRRIAKT